MSSSDLICLSHYLCFVRVRVEVPVFGLHIVCTSPYFRAFEKPHESTQAHRKRERERNYA